MTYLARNTVKGSKCTKSIWDLRGTLKGTHAWEFHTLFLNLFCFFQALIDAKRSTANIFENILQIRLDIQSFQSLPVFAERAKLGWALSLKTQS
jgi:hypothetical protein